LLIKDETDKEKNLKKDLQNKKKEFDKAVNDLSE
jgi:hypothetical protein